MALFKINDIKKQLEKTVSTVTEAVQNVPDTVKEINVEDALKQVSKVGEVFNINSDTVKSARQVLHEKKDRTDALTPKSVNRLFYYLMAADGKILSAEEEKLEEIGNEIDPHFNEYWEGLRAECGAKLAAGTDPESYHDILWDCINQTIADGIAKKDSVIAGKLLIWNLYVMAYSDGEMSDEESHMIRYVSRKLNIDPAIPLEMEHSFRTINAVEKEINWLKTEPRSYSEIQMHVEELEKRRTAIMQGIVALIED